MVILKFIGSPVSPSSQICSRASQHSKGIQPDLQLGLKVLMQSEPGLSLQCQLWPLPMLESYWLIWHPHA